MRVFTAFGLLCWATLAAADDLEGIWHGAIQVPGTPLGIELSFHGEKGTISIAAQGLKDVPLIDLRQNDERVTFGIDGIPGKPLFQGEFSEDSREISGTFTQHGSQIPFSVAKGDPTTAARNALAALDAIGKQAIKDFNVPGTAIAVVYKGELVYANAFGYRDIANRKPMNVDTLFAIGSTTKAMTATVLGMLVDEGKLEWDKPVRSYLPYFRLSDDGIGNALTVRDLVTHRSGMPRHDLLWYNFNDGSREALIRRFANLELTAGLRERFQYNNLMYMTAGHIGAKVADSNSWEDLMEDRLFEPLGMARTNLSVLVSQQDDNHALPYSNEDDKLKEIPYRRIDMVGPAGAVNSSLNEMVKWLQFNLDHGAVGDTQLVSRSTLKDILSHHMPTDRGSPDPMLSPSVYGLGWFISTYRGHRHVYHGGGIDGFITSVMLFPNDELGLVAFANTSSSLGQWLNLTAADLVLGYDDRNWLDQAIAREKATKGAQAQSADDPRQKRGTKPTHRPDDYAGRYSHPSYGDLDVLVDKRRLEVSFNEMSAPLEHWHYNVWEVDPDASGVAFGGTKLHFGIGLHGEVATVAVRMDTAARPIVFAKQPDSMLRDPSYLKQFVGTYKTPTGQKAVVELRGSELAATVGQQPTYVLAPVLGGRFELKSLPGYQVVFGKDELTFIQPNGVFRSERVDG